MNQNITRKSTQNLLSILNENKLLILRNIYHCEEDVCNCDIVKDLKISKNLISYHIKTLRQKGFIEEEKCGRHTSYKIAKGEKQKVKEILQVLEMIIED